jgi:hypothetical protein
MPLPQTGSGMGHSVGTIATQSASENRSILLLGGHSTRAVSSATHVSHCSSTPFLVVSNDSFVHAMTNTAVAATRAVFETILKTTITGPRLTLGYARDTDPLVSRVVTVAYIRLRTWCPTRYVGERRSTNVRRACTRMLIRACSCDSLVDHCLLFDRSRRRDARSVNAANEDVLEP